MNEGVEKMVNTVPIMQVAELLLAEGERPLETPRSYAIQDVRDIPTVRAALEKLAKLPYEFSITFESKIKRWVLSTGERYHLPHIFHGKPDEEFMRRLHRDPRFLHNHPVQPGCVDGPASPMDFLVLAKLGEIHRISMTVPVITVSGIEIFGFEKLSSLTPDEIDQLWDQMVVRFNVLPSFYKNGEIEKVTQEEWEKYRRVRAEYISMIGGVSKYYSWTDPKSEKILADFFA